MHEVRDLHRPCHLVTLSHLQLRHCCPAFPRQSFEAEQALQHVLDELKKANKRGVQAIKKHESAQGREEDK